MLVLLLIFLRFFLVGGVYEVRKKHWWWWWCIEHENDVASPLLSWWTPVNRLLLWSPLLCDPLSTTRTGTAIHIVMNRTTLHILSAATSTTSKSTTSDRHSFNFSNAHLDDVNYTRHKNHQLPWLDHRILKIESRVEKTGAGPHKFANCVTAVRQVLLCVASSVVCGK